jgi:hypothetical protein
MSKTISTPVNDLVVAGHSKKNPPARTNSFRSRVCTNFRYVADEMLGAQVTHSADQGIKWEGVNAGSSSWPSSAVC